MAFEGMNGNVYSLNKDPEVVAKVRADEMAWGEKALPGFTQEEINNLRAMVTNDNRLDREIVNFSSPVFEGIASDSETLALLKAAATRLSRSEEDMVRNRENTAAAIEALNNRWARMKSGSENEGKLAA